MNAAMIPALIRPICRQVTALMAAFVLGCAVTGTPCASAAFNSYEGTIEGKWVFHQMIYQGEIRPPLNPNLLILFEFRSDGTDRLYWTRLDQTGFCERVARYTYEFPFLSEEVIWANPANAFECSRDPDMSPGRRGTTRLERHAGKNGDELYLHLGLGDEPLIYVWRACAPEEALCLK